MLYYTILCYTLLYYTYYAILYYTILYYTILYYTTFLNSSRKTPLGARLLHGTSTTCRWGVAAGSRRGRFAEESLVETVRAYLGVSKNYRL